MILARLVRSESFWAVVKVRSPHTGPEVCYIIEGGCLWWAVVILRGYNHAPLRSLGRV